MLAGAPTLRPYQERAVQLLRERIKDRPLLSLSVGAGKTVIIAEVVRRFDKRALLCVHRDELVRQSVAKLEAVGVTPGVIKAGYPENRDRPIQVASVQTLARRKFPEVDMLILDEVHHAPSPTWARIVEHYRDILTWGCSGTPYRMDGKGLGSAFGCILEPITARELCEQGWLIAPTIYSQPEPDLKGVHVQAGDYKPDELAAAVNKPHLVGDVVKTWLRLAPGRPTLCFAASIAHSKAIVDAFNAAGVPAEHLDGSTPDDQRRAALARLNDGTTKVISNCSLFGEGVDLPSVSCVIVAVPTMSRARYVQMAGRGMRPCDGKTDFILLDHGGCALEFGPPTEELILSLTGRVRVARPAPIQRCKKCLLISPGNPCRNCGATYQAKPHIPRHLRGELALLEAKKPLSTWEQRQSARYLRFLTTCEDKHHKPAYANFLFRNDQGFFPSKRVRQAAQELFDAGTRVRDPGGDPASGRLEPIGAPVS